MSSQIWCYLKFPLPMGGGGGGECPQETNCSKLHETHFGFGIFEIRWFFGGHGGGRGVSMKKLTDNQPTNQPSIQTYGHYGD